MEQKSFLMGALIALVSVAVGASSALISTSITAQSGHNPNNFSKGVERVGNTDFPSGSDVLHLVPNVHRLQRIDYGAAPEYTVDPSHCDGLSRVRRTHCLVELRNNIEYQLNQTGY